jgi:hypothetical protein
MSTTLVQSPSSILRLGYARADITPPVGIYHRMWGAARHDRASGVHRPLNADLLLLEPFDAGGERLVRLQLDLVLLNNEHTEELISGIVDIAAVPRDRILVTHSHSHSAGFFLPNRIPLPGGELIEPYLASLKAAVEDLAREALASLDTVTITYAYGRCDLAANRDYRDSEAKIYATGFNPDEDADDLVVTARVCAGPAADGEPRLSIVHYACHPTTLAWDNSLLSPDFVGAMREVVETATEVPCVYFQRPCGDLGPRDGFVGDTDVADRNGRQLGYAALSALSSLGPPGHDFAYQGPVVSGATIGTWGWTPFDDRRHDEASRWRGDTFTVDLPYRSLPDADTLSSDLQRYSQEQARADADDDPVKARDLGARAERCRRWLARLAELPEGDQFPYRFSVFQFGDALWITCSAEPYSLLARELCRRYPDMTTLISPIAGDAQLAYLLPEEKYGIGLYQEEPSCLGPGCLESLIESLSERIEEVTGQPRIA